MTEILILPEQFNHSVCFMVKGDFESESRLEGILKGGDIDD